MVEDEGQILLVLEYMEGGPVLSRAALSAGARLPEELARSYFHDMCKVLARAHFRNVGKELTQLALHLKKHFRMSMLRLGRPALGCRRSSPAFHPATCARCFRGRQFAMLPNYLRPC